MIFILQGFSFSDYRIIPSFVDKMHKPSQVIFIPASGAMAWTNFASFPWPMRSASFNFKGKPVNCSYFKFTIDEMQWCGVKCIHPAGYPAMVLSALFSSSGSGRVTQRNNCVSESHRPSFALLTFVLILVYVRKETTVFSIVIQRLVSSQWCGI